MIEIKQAKPNLVHYFIGHLILLIKGLCLVILGRECMNIVYEVTENKYRVTSAHHYYEYTEFEDSVSYFIN